MLGFATFAYGLSFGAPYLLWALLLLPAIYWLLRVTPPAPKRITFPPLRLLLGLKTPEETPARTPLWLLLFRLLAAAIAILALADPVFDATPTTQGTGPLVIVVDNDWAAAQNWQTRVDAMHSALNIAARDERRVAILGTAENAPVTPVWMEAERAAATVDDMVPRPWLPDRAAALAALNGLEMGGGAQLLWLSNGIDDEDASTFADGLADIGALSIFADGAAESPLALRPPVNGANGFEVTVIRVPSDEAREGNIVALDGRGRTLEDVEFRFTPNAAEASALIALPVEFRNETVRIAIRGVDSAGTTQLIDARFRRRPVGLLSGNTANANQPLLSDIFYLERALQPYVELRKGSLEQLLDGGIAILVLADIGQLTEDEHEQVQGFVEDGGVLMRFAGPRLATSAGDGIEDLLPVRLRTGERLMGSALAWAEPQSLAPFTESSPFRGLVIPEDVTVSRQVLAEPSIELAEHVWALLEDGTPLVTGAELGRGWIVLFHVGASPGWSSLPLSGLYVEMLRRVVDMSGGLRNAANLRTGIFPPFQTLDGFGRLVRPYPEALSLDAEQMADLPPGPQHPPGLYGNEGAVIAMNAVSDTTALEPLTIGRPVFNYETGGIVRPLKWPLLEIVLAMILADALISLFLRGHVTHHSWRRAPGKAAAASLLLSAVLFGGLAFTPQAQASEEKNIAAALDTRLAYVITGVPDVDEMSRAGLFGLGLVLRARTAYEPTEPMGVDLETDDLAFYPLLYWPMTPAQADLSPAVVAKVDAFMRTGGTLLFDTRDEPLAGLGMSTLSTGETTLRRLLAKLDIPPLEPVPPDHVLTKAFYLLNDFPGRWLGGQVWVEAIPPLDPDSEMPARGGDGVSPIIIGGNDWAAAWALDNEGYPIAAVVPGGEIQREMAMRFGVNLVIYAMTGNYKTDQVHVPALLERLGQ